MCSIKKAVLKNFTIFTERHLCWETLAGLNGIKKRLQHRCFSVNITKF